MFRLLFALCLITVSINAHAEIVSVGEFTPTSGRILAKPRAQEFGEIISAPGQSSSYLRFSLPDRPGINGFLVLREPTSTNQNIQEQRRLLARTYLAGKIFNFGLVGCVGSDVVSNSSSFTVYLGSVCRVTFWQEWAQ